MTFYSTEEVIIAMNEEKISKHANIKCKVNVRDAEGTITSQIIDTVAGRLVFNQFVPDEVGYVNELLTKKSCSRLLQL